MDAERKAMDVISRNEDVNRLVPLLNFIQEEVGFIPEKGLKKASEKTGVPLSHAYSVVRFFTDFSLRPTGEYKIEVCSGTACHVKGAEKVLDQLSRKLGIEEGETTDDGMFTLETVRCIGCCSIAPVMRINEEVYGKLDQEKVVNIIDELKEEGDTE
ncbi:MAG: NAD(P)H-dependent oxidoreductase subunit E [Thermoplasmatota archaeon]